MTVERLFFLFGCSPTFFHAEMVYFSGVQKGLDLPKYILIFRSAVNGNLRITRLFTEEDQYGSESSTLFLNGKGDLI